MKWKQFFRETARHHIRQIRWRKANGLPYDKRIEDLRFCLAERHKA